MPEIEPGSPHAYSAIALALLLALGRVISHPRMRQMGEWAWILDMGGDRHHIQSRHCCKHGGVCGGSEAAVGCRGPGRSLTQDPETPGTFPALVQGTCPWPGSGAFWEMSTRQGGPWRRCQHCRDITPPPWGRRGRPETVPRCAVLSNLCRIHCEKVPPLLPSPAPQQSWPLTTTSHCFPPARDLACLPSPRSVLFSWHLF